MKNLFLLLISCCVLGNFASAQNSCANPDTLISGQVFNGVLPVSTGSAPIGPNYSCLGSQNNPYWLFVETCDPGQQTWTLTASDLSGTGVDIDFICWGPITGVTALSDLCTQVSLGTMPVVDCSYNTSGNETIEIPNSQAGEFYLIMITNFSNIPGIFTLNQTAGIGQSCNAVSPTQYCGVETIPVCELTMNDSANHCKILWEKPIGLSVDQFYIYRLNSMSVFQLIDSISDSDSSFYIDYTSNPAIQSYRYKINYKDTCGNIGNLSSYHQSIHLQSSPGFNSVHLNWNNYFGFSYPSYYILRGTDPFSMIVIDSISSAFLTYTDVNPIPGQNYYQIGITNPDPCFVSRDQMFVVSNISSSITNSVEEIHNFEFSMYPNPADQFITITSTKTEFNFSVIDINGRTIILNSSNAKKRHEISTSNLANGIYLVKIEIGDSEIIKKMVITH